MHHKPQEHEGFSGIVRRDEVIRYLEHFRARAARFRSEVGQDGREPA